MLIWKPSQTQLNEHDNVKFYLTLLEVLQVCYDNIN